MEITSLQIAWAAGVYEGDGSCSPNGVGGARIGARVIQKDRWILERLCDLFGGSIAKHDTTLRDRAFAGFAWHVSGARARGFLMTIYPFLSPWRAAAARTALLRTRRAMATADFCRRGHPVSLYAGHQKSGRYCRACKNEKARARYRSDESYRRAFLARQYAGRISKNGATATVPPRRPQATCRRGHPFTPENTILNRYRGRQCRACWNALNRRRYHARKAAVRER